MKKTLVALALTGAFAVPAFADEAPASPHTFTGNVGLVSDYVFRGISQSQNGPAVQGGFDYSHSSGIYVGTWASNVSWVSATDGTYDPYKRNNSLEVDVYGGYKGTFAGDFSYDLGVLTYIYPGDKVAGMPDTDSTEVYAAIGWKFITLKYNYTVSSHLFGWTGTNGEKTEGSGYIDLAANYDLGDGWGVNGHVGHQDIRHNSNASYTDWKLGVTKDLGVGVVGLTYTDTDTDKCGSTNLAYCWNNKSVGKAKAVLSFSKTF